LRAKKVSFQSQEFVERLPVTVCPILKLAEDEVDSGAAMSATTFLICNKGKHFCKKLLRKIEYKRNGLEKARQASAFLLRLSRANASLLLPCKNKM